MDQQMQNQFSPIALLALAILLLAGHVSALSQEHLPLQDMTAMAENILYVEVLEVRESEVPLGDSFIPATFYRCEVLEGFKGSAIPGMEWTVTQPIVPSTAGAGLPAYEEGKRYLLFLGRESPDTGFSAPVGLGQGVFAELPPLDSRLNGDARPRLRNQYNNVGLFDGLEEDQILWFGEQDSARRTQTQEPFPEELQETIEDHKVGPVVEDHLFALVRRLVVEARSMEPEV